MGSSAYVSLLYTEYTHGEYGHVLPGGIGIVSAIGLYDSNNNEVGHADGTYINNDNNKHIFYIKPYNGHERGTFDLVWELVNGVELPSGNYTLKVHYVSNITSNDFDISIVVPSDE